METAISGRGVVCSEVGSQRIIYLGIKEDVGRRRLKIRACPGNRGFRPVLDGSLSSLAGRGESWKGFGAGE